MTSEFSNPEILIFIQSIFVFLLGLILELKKIGGTGRDHGGGAGRSTPYLTT